MVCSVKVELPRRKLDSYKIVTYDAASPRALNNHNDLRI